MTAPNYHSSTKAVILGGFLKYAAFPIAYGTALTMTRNVETAKTVARVACTALSTLVTTTFFGLESKVIDDTGREAVSAAMGIDADKLQFSDYSHCSNTIVREGTNQFLGLQKYRYATDFMFMLPSIVEFVGKEMNGGKLMKSKEVRDILDSRTNVEIREKLIKDAGGKPPTWIDVAIKGHHGLDMSVYGANAAYWAYETFMIPKNGYYSVVKHLENNEGTGKDISVGDLWEIYQRTRVDNKLPMIALDAKAEYSALRPLLQRIVTEYNKHDGKLGKSEMVYLLGENKITVHLADNKTISEAAIAQSNKEIDKVLAIGLAGIREENKKLRQQGLLPGAATQTVSGNSVAHNMPVAENRSFVDRFTNGSVDVVQKILAGFGMIPERPIQPISQRDPALANLSSGASR